MDELDRRHGDLSDDELLEVARILHDRIGEVTCLRCGSFRPRFQKISTLR